MSTLISEESVEIVILTLNKRDGSGTTNFWLGRHFYLANEVYSGNSVVYPVLAESPIAQTSVGINVGNKHDIEIRCYGNNHLTEHGKSLIDLKKDYVFHGSAAVIRYYTKPIDTTTTDSGENVRKTLEIQGMAQDGDGIVSLLCVDNWFKDREFTKRLTQTDFTDLPDEWDGEYGAHVFGEASTAAEGIPIASPVIDSNIDGSNRPNIKIFAGWTGDGTYKINDLERVYVRNQHKEQDNADWLQINLPSDPQTAGHGDSGITGTATSLATYTVAIVFSPSTTANVCHAVSARLQTQGSPTTDTGAVECLIYHAEYQGTGDTWEPVGAPLRNVTIDVEDLSASWSQAYFQLKNPLVMSPNANYMIVLEWTNHEDTTNFVDVTVDTSATGETYYRVDHSGTNKGFDKIADQQAAIALWFIGKGDDDFADGNDGYAYQHLEGKAVSLLSSQSRLEINEGVEYKCAVSGIQDSSGGTVSGSGSSLLKSPSHIVELLLRASEFANVASAKIDNTAFGAAHTSYSGKSFDLRCAVSGQRFVEEMITNICRQTGMIFYKKNDGVFTVKIPDWDEAESAIDHKISWGRLGGMDLGIVQLIDNDFSFVINDVEISYAPDELNVSSDEAQLRRASGRFSKIAFVNASSTNLDCSGRKVMATTSESLFGKRQMRESFDCIDDDNTIRRMVYYYFDRFCCDQQRLTFRVQRKNYYSTIDLFDRIKVSHVHLPAKGGHNTDVKASLSGAPVEPQLNNSPVQVWSGGNFKGFVTGVTEFGPWMEVTIEKTPGFSII